MFIGMDLGTSELKLLLLDEHHQVLATVSEPLQVSRPQPLWSEQAPGDWWTATDAAMGRLLAAQPEAMRQVRAIGLSGQMHGAVVLDTNDQVLRPAILWNDGRSGAECEWLMQALPQLPAIAGNLAMPGFTAPKLVWLARHEPALFERIACVLLPKDWLRLQLTGDKVGDMSDAAGTLWLDVAKRDWSDELLAACGLNRSHMPRLVEGSEVSGRLRPSLAQRWGLPADVLVAGGGGDNAASAVGIGAVKPGQGFLSLGTSGVLFVCNDRFRPNPASAVHAFCHALPARWHQMSVMLSAASCLAWAAKLTGQSSVATLLAQAATLTEAEKAAAPLFLPYLSGERTPHNNPHASGSLSGLTHEHGPAHVAHAVMEGVAFGLRDGWRALAGAGTEVGELSLVGGGARSALWAQMLASALDLPLVGHAGSVAGGALGAARLGWLAAGGDEAQVCIAPPVAQRWEPEPAERERLLARYARFASLYPALHVAAPLH